MPDEIAMLDDRSLAALVQGGHVDRFNAYREAWPDQFINFRGEMFSHVALSGINLREVGLRETTFLDCSLIQAQFQRAFAVGATFSTCLLYRANFCGCDLQGAVFNVANLHDAYTYGAYHLDWRYRVRLLCNRRRRRPAPPEMTTTSV